jgi:hypothetical protein
MLRAESFVRPCEWDRRTVPYRPSVPVLLGWYSAAAPTVYRVVVPDVEGLYWDLVPGRAYVERQLVPVVLPDCTSRPLPRQDKSTQVDWDDLPEVREDDLHRFLPANPPPELRPLRRTMRSRPV